MRNMHLFVSKEQSKRSISMLQHTVTQYDLNMDEKAFFI